MGASGNPVGAVANRDRSPLAAAPTEGKRVRGITRVAKKMGFRRHPQDRTVYVLNFGK